MYADVKSLCNTPEANIISYINYISIKSNNKKRRRVLKKCLDGTEFIITISIKQEAGFLYKRYILTWVYYLLRKL